MELSSLRFSVSRSSVAKAKDNLKVVNSIIRKVQAFLWGNVRTVRSPMATAPLGHSTKHSTESWSYGIAPCPGHGFSRLTMIFSTKRRWTGWAYLYANGFSGVVERRFNPSTFRYALAEQLDLTSRKWSSG